jgi:catechol 2,3-dioxygenase-like lactoylglutathione lyase family enzyme
MQPNACSHLRIARPSRNLTRAERFWVDGLGLSVLYRTATDTDDDHALLMLGWPDAAWHLELVEDLDGETPPSPSEEDLLVLYLGRPVHDDVIDRHLAAGGE